MEKTILIIDDDPIAQFIHERLLNSMEPHVNIRVAADGAQGLLELQACIHNERELPDSIIVDLDMPVMDGRSFLEAYRQLRFEGKEKIKICVSTSVYRPFTSQECEYFGIKCFGKPLSKDAVADILDIVGFKTKKVSIL